MSHVGVKGTSFFTQVKNGELAGSVTSVTMPNVGCLLVRFVAASSNTGNVYLGGAPTVTAPNGATDTTTGFQLAPGEETGWIPVTNLNLFAYICDNATDDLLYIALV